MRLLIFEDICGAGYRCDFILPPELPDEFHKLLVIEGAAMMKAVVEDFSQLPLSVSDSPLEIITHWDRRGGIIPFEGKQGIEVVQVDSSRSGQRAWNQSLKTCDTVLFIAPEYQGRAYNMQLEVLQNECSSLNSLPSAIRLCSDKLEFFRHLQEHNIATIPTFSSFEKLSNSQYVVAKQRDGVGSMSVEKMLFKNAERHSHKPGSYQLIWQPFVAGETCSVGCFINSKTGHLTVLPTARQFLSNDGHFKYEGGEIPAANVDQQAVKEMATQVAHSIEGLHGYFGIDFIVGEDQKPIVVELNPRITTSYVGYRAMTSQNLAELFFNDVDEEDIEWQNHVRFEPNGKVFTRPL
ncbi:ATP-grasp domain-containing protein [Planctomicrobium sp.]|jgi:tyramine---L-glutamate ligase|nr:ATP-grasp domain-containing protein [Planctomicrobium sp.]MDB4743476.1 ATP-grasp domain-containing protein [Planctomicrobium sp.]MDB4802589.1 ATP-grasp domain-containing protein [bacterium]